MGGTDDPDLRWAVDLLNYGDPDQTGRRMVLADDLMAGRADRAGLQKAADRLAALRADPAITDAEIKGLLNRASNKTWGGEYDRVFEPREFVAELERAMRDYLRRRPDLR